MSEKPIKISKLREQILDKRGLERVQGAHFEPLPPDPELTSLMKLKELEFGEPIRSLIAPSRGTIYQVAKHLGVHPSTVFLWRERLGIS